MARCKADWCESDHAFCMRSRPFGNSNPAGRFRLVRGGRFASLSARADEGPGFGAMYLLRGPVALRKLAYAILREVKAPKKARRAGKKTKERKVR
jgi:hypothetical protein